MKMKRTSLICALVFGWAGSAAYAATTVKVENGSTSPLLLAVEQWPAGEPVGLASVVGARGSTATRKRGAKVLAEHGQADRHVVSIVYLNSKGDGCRFRTATVRHSAAMARIVPVAEAVGTSSCSAETGATIGDFVFRVR